MVNKDLKKILNNNLEKTIRTYFVTKFIKFYGIPSKDIDMVNDTEIPKGWKIGHFEDMIEEIIPGDWGKEEKIGNYTDLIYCIRGMDIPNLKKGNLIEMAKRYVITKNHENKKIQHNDLVIELSGGTPTQSTGRITLITKELLDFYDNDILCTNFCKIIRTKDIFKYFVYYYWDYLYEQNRMFAYENGTTGIKNLDYKALIKKEELVIPPETELNKFNNTINDILIKIYKNGVEITKLTKLRDTLLPKLMSGEIDVSGINFDFLNSFFHLLCTGKNNS